MRTERGRIYVGGKHKHSLYCYSIQNQRRIYSLKLSSAERATRQQFQIALYSYSSEMDGLL